MVSGLCLEFELDAGVIRSDVVSQLELGAKSGFADVVAFHDVGMAKKAVPNTDFFVGKLGKCRTSCRKKGKSEQNRNKPVTHIST